MFRFESSKKYSDIERDSNSHHRTCVLDHLIFFEKCRPKIGEKHTLSEDESYKMKNAQEAQRHCGKLRNL